MAQTTFVGTRHSGVWAIMPELHHKRMFKEDGFLHQNGRIDYERAIGAGIRIFAFLNENKAPLPFVGTVVDLQEIIASRKIRVTWDGGFYVPFTNPFQKDESFQVTEDDFRLHFGPDFWTSVFPRQK